MGTAALRKLQYGVEATHGLAVAATKMLPVAVPQIKTDRTPTFPRENAGVKADAVRSYVSGMLVRDSLKFDTLYFQTLPMLFSCGVKGDITPAEQTGGQGDYLWDHGPEIDETSNEQNSLTIERGDDTFAVETEYCMFERIKLSGVITQDGNDSSMKADADYFGRQNTSAAFTGALTPQAGLTPVNAQLARFYLDTSWGGVGGTEKTATLRSYDIEILTGLHPKFHGSGFEYFDTHGEGALAIMAAFTFEGNANMAAIYSAWQAASLQVARIKVTGPQIGTGEVHTLQIDLGGAWEQVIPLASEDNGNDLWTAVLRGYASGGTDLMDIQVITNLAAL